MTQYQNISQEHNNTQLNHKLFSAKSMDATEFGCVNIQLSVGSPARVPVWFTANCFTLTLVIDASGRYETKTRSFDVRPGTIFFSRPDGHRKLEWNNLKEVYHVTFSEDFLLQYAGIDLFKTFPFLLLETVLPKRGNLQMFEDLRRIFQQIDKHDGGTLHFRKNIIANLLTRLLYLIKRDLWDDQDMRSINYKEHDVVQCFIKNLEHHYLQLLQGKATIQLRVKDYAMLQGLNENYFSNIIKEKTGKIVSHWIADKTILLAKRLLGDKSLSIKEISYRLGFPYIPYFTIFFKKHTGYTPKDYRKINSV